MYEPNRDWQAPTQEELLGAARHRFLKGEKIELQAIAEELGISRATAYRWGGNNEQLTGQVIASLVEDTLKRTRGEVRARGAERVRQLLERGMRYTANFKPLRAFLERDAQKGLRLIASKDGPVQGRTIELIQQILEEEIARDALKLPVDTHTMAYALTRVIESFLYADLIAGEAPDLEKASAILKLMLQSGKKGRETGDERRETQARGAAK